MFSFTILICTFSLYFHKRRSLSSRSYPLSGPNRHGIMTDQKRSDGSQRTIFYTQKNPTDPKGLISLKNRRYSVSTVFMYRCSKQTKKRVATTKSVMTTQTGTGVHNGLSENERKHCQWDIHIRICYIFNDIFLTEYDIVENMFSLATQGKIWYDIIGKTNKRSPYERKDE